MYKQFVGGLAILLAMTSASGWFAFEQLKVDQQVKQQTTVSTVSKVQEETPVLTETQTVSPPKLASRGDIQLQPPEPPKEEVRYYNVPLSHDLQKYIWDLCKEQGLPYEMIVATIHEESRFNPMASSGVATGLMQINTSDGTFSWLARECGISNPDPTNPYHSVKMGIWYLGYLNKQWIERGVTERNLSASLLSYNMGDGGAQKYIRNYGYTSQYTTKVWMYNDKLLNGEVQ